LNKKADRTHFKDAGAIFNQNPSADTSLINDK